MTTLAAILLAPARRDILVRRTADWVTRYVAARSGLRGMTLRAGLGAAQAARPDIVERAVAHLLPQFAEALEPLWQRHRAEAEGDFSDYLRRHAAEATAALMAVADARAARGTNRPLLAVYRRLRGTLQHELQALLPDLAKMMGETLR